MMKLIHKFLIPIFIIITMFFIDNKVVKADVDECHWEMYQSYITNTDTGVHGVNAIEKYDDNAKFKWDLYYDTSWASNFRIEGKNYKNKFSSTNFEKNTLNNSTICPKYVVVSEKNDNEEVDVATSDEFKNYYNTQYDGILQDNSTDNSEVYISTPIYNISKKPIVFVSHGYMKYPSKHLDETKKNADNADISNKLGIATCLKGCSIGVKEFYEATKSKWFQQVNSMYSNIVCENGTCKVKNTNYMLRKAFAKWFESEEIARLVFEESYDQFLKCYKLKLLVDDNLTQEKFDYRVATVNSIIKLDDYNKYDNDLTQNPCLSICTFNNGKNCEKTVLEECKKGNLYKSCTSAYSNCNNISSTTAYDQCMKNSMGEDNYNSYTKKLIEEHNSINECKENAKNELRDYLKRIDAAGLEGVEIGPSEINCEDVEVFHTIYNIMVIAAPILVILLGSIDYAKAVFSTDEKKMEESKKKFPKRLLLLVLFVAVPTIIRIILSISNGETTLMDCIIRGK